MGGLGRSAGLVLQFFLAASTVDCVLAASKEAERGAPCAARSRNLRAYVNLSKGSVNGSTASGSQSATVLAEEATRVKHRVDRLQADNHRLVGRLLEAQKARVDQVKELEARNTALEKRVAREEAASAQAEAAKAQAKADSTQFANDEFWQEQSDQHSIDEDYDLLWAAEKLGELRRSNANLSRGLEKERAMNVEVRKQVKQFVQQDLERAEVSRKQVAELRDNSTRLQDLAEKDRRELATQQEYLEKERKHESIDEARIQKLQGELQEEKDEVSSLQLDKQSLMKTVKGLLPNQEASHSQVTDPKHRQGPETELSEKANEQEQEMQAKEDAIHYLQSQLARLQTTIASLSIDNQQLRQSQLIQKKEFQEQQDSLLKKIKGSEAQYVREEANTKALLFKLKSMKAQNSNLNAAVDKEIRQVDTISEVQSEKLQKLKAVNHKLLAAWQKALNISNELRQEEASKSKQLAMIEGELHMETKLEKKYKAEAVHERQVMDQKQAMNEKLRVESQKSLHIVETLKKLEGSKERQLAELKQKYEAETELEEKYKAQADPTAKALNKQFRASIQQSLAANKELRRENAADTQKFQKEQSTLKQLLQAAKANNTALRKQAAEAKEQNSRLAAEMEHMDMLNASVAILTRDKMALADDLVALNDTLQQEKHELEVKLQKAKDALMMKSKQARADHEMGKIDHAVLEKEREVEAELRLSRANLKKEKRKLQAVLGKEANMEDEEHASRANIKKEGDDVVAALKRVTDMQAEMRMTQRATDMKSKAMWALMSKISELKSTADALRDRNEKLESTNKKLASSLQNLRVFTDSEEILQHGRELEETFTPDTSLVRNAIADTQKLAVLNRALKKQLDSESELA